MPKFIVTYSTPDSKLKQLIGKYIFEIVADHTSPHYQFLSAAGSKVVGIKRADEDPNLIAILFKGGIGFVFERGIITYREELPDAV